jgi:hypothetical protein
MGGSFAVLVAALAAAPTTYEISLRTEGRTGTAYLGTATQFSVLELDPAAVLSTRFDKLTIDGGYRPQLLYSLNVDHTFALLHRADLGGKWTLSRKTRLSFTENVSFGKNNFSPLLAITGTTPQDPHLPQVLVLDYFNTSSSVGVTYSTLTGIELAGSASFSLYGGFGSVTLNRVDPVTLEIVRVSVPTQSLIPPARTWSLTGNAAFEVNRNDAVTSRASANVSTFSFGATDQEGQARAPGQSQGLTLDTGLGWRHQFTKVTQGDVSAGVYFSRFTQPGVPATTVTATWGPSAGLGVSHQLLSKRLHQLRGSARVSYGAAIDPYGFGVYHRVDSTLIADYTAMGWLSFSLRGTGARGLSPPELRNSLWQLEFTSTFTVDRHIGIGAGVRGAWLSNPSAGALYTGFQWAAFLGMTVRQDGKF